MQVILQGSLRHFPAGELLPLVSRRTESGTLDLETAGRRTRILFRGEKIIWAESNRGGEVAEVVLDACEWATGTFTLLDSAAIPDGATLLGLDLASLLEEAKRRAAGAVYVDTTLFRVVDDPALQQQVSLTSDEFKLLFRLGGGRMFKELLAELAVPRKELTERLKHLAEIGLISVVREEPPVEQEAVPTAPQKKTAVARKRTLVGSLTPDARPDSVWPLLDANYTIGRAAENAIIIPDGSVSSNHARITRTEEGFFLEDLQSRNGTFVNGEKVAEKRLLVDGDLIRVGKIIMTFNIARETKPGDTTQPEVRLG